eukprot:scaffold23600_cov69-Phaeocystis_antarctica.AAC.3
MGTFTRMILRAWTAQWVRATWKRVHFEARCAYGVFGTSPLAARSTVTSLSRPRCRISVRLVHLRCERFHETIELRVDGPHQESNRNAVAARGIEECCGRRRGHVCQRQHRSRCRIQRRLHSQPICEHKGRQQETQHSQHTALSATALSTRPKPDPLAIPAVSFVTELADELHRPRAESWARRCVGAHGAPCWWEERSSSLRSSASQASAYKAPFVRRGAGAQLQLLNAALAHGWRSAVWLKPAEITNRACSSIEPALPFAAAALLCSCLTLFAAVALPEFGPKLNYAYIPCEARAVRTIPAPGEATTCVPTEPPSVAYGLGVTRRPCSALQCSYAHSFFWTTPSHA